MSWPTRLIVVATLSAAVALCSSRSAAIGGQETNPPIDFGREVRYFGGEPAGFPLPDHKLLEDPINNHILNMALGGVTRAVVERAGIADADSRLTALVKGQCLTIDGGTYRVRFPRHFRRSPEGVRALVDAAVHRGETGRGHGRACGAAVPGRRDALFRLVVVARDGHAVAAGRRCTRSRKGPAARGCCGPITHTRLAPITTPCGERRDCRDLEQRGTGPDRADHGDAPTSNDGLRHASVAASDRRRTPCGRLCR